MVEISFCTQNVPQVIYFEINKAYLVFMTIFFEIFASDQFGTKISHVCGMCRTVFTVLYRNTVQHNKDVHRTSNKTGFV